MFTEVLKLYTLPALPEDWHRLFVEDILPTFSIAFFVILLVLEMIAMRHKPGKKIMLQSYRSNIFTFLFNDLLLSLLSVSSLLLLADQYHHNGLLSDYQQPLQLVLAFVLFDLTLYLWHWANHQHDGLWMFHKVHHSDRVMNVSTAFRVHFIEVVLTTLVKALFIIAVGVDVYVVAICEAVSLLFVMFHHLNLSFRNERWLKWLFIVPAMHRVHHSSLRIEHDSNYGAVFSIWDRLFQTYSELQIGTIGLNNIKAMNFFQLLYFGMTPNTSTSTQPRSIDKDAMVAEAAYYIAEKRGFASGCEINDWLNAEQQINADYLQT